MISSEKNSGRPTSCAASIDDLLPRLRPGVVLQVLVGVLDHDDRRVDHGADGDRDAAEAHDVRAEADVPHRHEREEDRERQRENRDERAAEVPEKDDAHERDDDPFLDQLLLQRVDRPLDEVRPVVGGDEFDTRRERRLHFVLHGFLDVLDDAVRVHAISDDDDAAGDVSFAVQFCDAAAHVRTQVHTADVLHEDGRAVPLCSQAHLFDVRDAFDVPPAAHHVFASGPLDDTATDVVVALAHRRDHHVDWHVVGEQRVRIDLDLVLLHVAADGCDLGDPCNAAQLILDVPVVQGSETRQVVLAGLVHQRVLETPSDAGRVRTQHRRHSRGKPSLQAVQVLEDAAACPVRIGAVLKNDVDERHVEIGEAADDLHVRR